MLFVSVACAGTIPVMTTQVTDAIFNAPFGLQNPHIQSILASLDFRRSKVTRRAQAMLDCQRSMLCAGGKEGSQLLSYVSTPENHNGKLAILLHGWEGSDNSLYVLSAGARLFNQGYQVLRLNLRDHGHSHHLNREVFHSCRLEETANAVEDAIRRLKPQQTMMAGFSLGGNFTLRIATTRVGQQLSKAVAICPVAEPGVALIPGEAHTLVYRAYFYRKWKRSIKKKHSLYGDEIDWPQVQRQRNFQQLTSHMISRYYPGFASKADYFQGYALTGNRLKDLGCSATVLMSRDDPIIRAETLQKLYPHPKLQVIYTDHGGHCGFIKNYRLDSFVDDFISEQFDGTD